LKNVEHLVAIDVSEHMIEHARSPIFADKITAGSIEYLVGDIYSEALTIRRDGEARPLAAPSGAATNRVKALDQSG
jgi:hypothetical protein